MPLFQRLKTGLAKTRAGLGQRLEGLFKEPSWNEATLAELEEILLAADVGVKATQRLADAANLYVRGQSAQELFSFLEREIVHILNEARERSTPPPPPLSQSPWVILFLGVNGVGKTTTIGKLAAQYRGIGKKVLLVAGDTFRAAAVEQLEVWGKRAGAEVIKQQAGVDPSAVVFDGLRAAKQRGCDVVMIDTAGRLHTKVHLIEEIKKIGRVIAREQPGAPHETLLVMDATTGQNGLQQARVFKEAMEITGIVLTKLDGTAKGGVVIGIQEELAIPVKYVGVGEDVEDLQPFDPARFVEALFAS
ncbi:MAG: signal recognition particle-docking protein FtsY [Deltaproteobacteria bacterium RIFCSPLOWO2_12_FULL_60_19]|nr:MAG: signal recognition particle-docking protein FtsY [Deltaproteobacteria bacterium RIFCSPLOWO2_12_FULL_60_19]